MINADTFSQQIIHTKLLVNLCASEAGWKSAFQTVSALVKMQASQSPCTLPSQWPSAAFLTYLHMELWELCFNSLFHLLSVYIMRAYFFKKEKKTEKRPEPVTCMTMTPNHEKISRFFSPFFLLDGFYLMVCWLLIEQKKNNILYKTVQTLW